MSFVYKNYIQYGKKYNTDCNNREENKFCFIVNAINIIVTKDLILKLNLLW